MTDVEVSEPPQKPPRGTRGEILLVDPRRVSLFAIGGISDARRPPEIRQQWRGAKVTTTDGDWDRGQWGTTVGRIDDFPFYSAFLDHFTRNVPWEETDYFRKYLTKMERGHEVRRPVQSRGGGFVTNPAEFLEYMRTYDDIFADIRDNGYRTQAELGRPDSLDEMRIGIDRDGRIISLGGRHRLVICKILGLKQVPMRLVVRHTQWAGFRQKVEQFAAERGGKLYERIDHPDLRYLKGTHSAERLALISRELASRDWSGKRLIDFGTHWGYWCQEMEKLGFRCVGIELNAEYAAIAEKIRIASEGEYTIWQGHLTKYPEPVADVCLALSIFHHLVKKDNAHASLVKFLARLKTSLMFFEPPTRNFVRYQAEEFAAFVSKHANLPNIKLLGYTRERPMYMLSRD
ncbi:MAG: hypothetical protein KIS73_13700 [Enhydrobacter sp.]|nr:hypothetical protein [Enhydrobacter sp.]